MADNTRIEWARHPITGKGASWNPIRARNRETGKLGHFCVHVSEGCRHCYAERMQPRFQNPVRYAEGDREKIEYVLDEAVLMQPLRWKAPRGIFVESMADLFEKGVPDWVIDQVFGVMAAAQHHIFFVLTKRPERQQVYVRDLFGHEGASVPGRTEKWLAQQMPDGRILFDHLPCHVITPLPNVWLGTSIEDQVTAETRLPYLLRTHAARRFASAEPLLGPIDLHSIPAQGSRHSRPHSYYDLAYSGGPGMFSGLDGRRIEDIGLDWVIVGGESGRGARPMHPEWARSLRDQCAASGTAFFFKQWGAWIPDRFFDNLRARGVMMLPDGTKLQLQDFDALAAGKFDTRGPSHFSFVGKKAAGRALDGIEHNAMPTIAEKETT